MRPRVVIAGATGFVGRNLGRALRPGYEVVGLTRVPPATPGDTVDSWRGCDLLSLAAAEAALEGADYAVYLVHSMMPSARLTQGDFWDFDLIVADNFARAAKRAGVRQILYLGGIVPGRDVLSHHLSSRHEVEAALRGYGVLVTTLRAGLVIGAEGSSFLSMARAVERLPILFCPPWSRTLTHPVALEDAVALLRFCLGNPDTYGRTYDIGGPELMSYETMMSTIARAMGVKRPIVRVPVSRTRIVQFFVTRVTGAPRALIAPLVDSLKYPIVARERTLNAMAGLPGTRFGDAVARALAQLRAGRAQGAQLPIAFHAARTASGNRAVRSVQRFPLPQGCSAACVAREYLSWLPNGLRALVAVDVEDDEVFRIRLRGMRRRPLLVLRRVRERSAWPDRWVFRIEGGLLAGSAPGQRLEFREALEGRFVIAALLDFRPRLPWFVYLATQAPLHLLVMRSFARHLRRAIAAAPLTNQSASGTHS